MKWTDRLLTVGAFFSVFGGYLFMKGPAANNQQLAFRVGVVVLGLVLVGMAAILKARSGKSGG